MVLFKKFNINSIEEFGFPQLKEKLTKKEELWWDLLEPKDIDGIISALNTIYNRKLELYYSLTPKESDRIRKFLLTNIFSNLNLMVLKVSFETLKNFIYRFRLNFSISIPYFRNLI